MADQVRVAIVGLGVVARAVHLPILTRRSDRFRLAGICDLSPTALAVAGERFGIPPRLRFRNLDEMLSAVDADVLAVLTSGSHSFEITRGLASGMAVFTEKPLAYTRREVSELEEAVEDRADRLMLGYMKVHDPAVAAAARETAGRGRPRSVEVSVLHPTAASQLVHSDMDPHHVDLDPEIREELDHASRALEREALGPAAEALGRVYSGVLLGSVVHDLAVMRALGVEIAEVDHIERWPTGVHPPSLAISARSSDGVRVCIRWHYLEGYPTYREEVRWHGQSGSVELTFPAPYLLRAPTILRVISGSEDAVIERVFRSPVEAFEEELLALHRMVVDGEAPPSGLAQGKADIVTCQQIAVRLGEAEGVAVGGEAGS